MDTATGPRLPPPDLRDRAVGLAAALRRELAGDVLADAAGRHLYAQDASAYRLVPALAALPRDADDVVASVTLAAEHGVPVTARGAGTSLAGQTVTWGLVLDTSRHLDRVVALDPDGRTAVVQPGVVLDDLRRAAGVHGLTFAPDPSTANRCTLGGMVGNDACGIHSILGGRTSDAVRRLDVVLADGTRLDAGPMDAAVRARAAGAGAGGRLATLVRDLTGVRDRHADAIATRLDDGLPRRVSGLHLEALTERHGFHLGRLLTGSEGTLAVTLAAEVDLVDWPPHRALVLAAYPTMADAGDAVPRLRVPVVDGGPIGYEALDATIAATPHVRARLPDAVALLPRLDDPDVTAWAILEVGGATPAEASANATRLAALAGADGTPAVVVTDPAAQARVWTLRKVGLGASTRVADPAAGGRPGGGGARWRWPGWEDAAVPPGRVGDHLRALADLLADHGLDAALYGHLGDGCVHARIGFEYGSAAGRATYRAFTAEAAALCASFGGSLSGEHGDGRARAELLPTLYGHDLVAAFAEVKRAFDPDGQLNPGVLVAPTSRTSHLHAHEDVAPVPLPTLTGRPQAFAYSDDLDEDGRGSFAVAVQRCVGVGACRRDDDAGVMCPTWRVTHDERHTTRGRARLLAELLRPDTTLERGASGVDDPAVHDALELCLSCKGCAADCPVGVDVATWKAEVTHQRWAGRRRPLRHHVLGRAADGLRLAGRAPGLVNALGALPLLPDLARRAVGLSTDRPLPRLAPTTLRRRLRAGGVPGPHDASTDAPAGGAADGTTTHHVVLFVDEVVDVLDPEVGVATVEVLAAAGAHVTLAPEVCCGRPLYDRGMLDRARTLLLDLLDALAPAVDAGATIVGMEPSCVAVLRDELPAMLPDDPRSARVAGATRTLAEHLVAVGWSPPDLTATHGPGAPSSPVLVQRHCHEHALRAGHPDADLLTAAGADVAVLDDGCCGMAGTFGWAAATEPTARAVGEDRLLPRVRAAPAGAVVLADGSSCRTQLAHLQDPAAGGHAGPHGPVPAVHLAQLLADALHRQDPPAPHTRQG